MNASMSAASAAELARSAFRRLAVLRLAPTPENYARIWAELAHARNHGGPVPEPAPRAPGDAAAPRPAPAGAASRPAVAQPSAGGSGAQGTACAAATSRPAPAQAAHGVPAAAAGTTPAAVPGAGVWRQMWEQGLHLGLIPASTDAQLQQKAAQLLGLAQGTAQAQTLLGDNRELWQRFERALAQERGTVDGMLELFSMLVSHVGDVFAGDSAAAAEFGTLQQVCRRPLDGSRIELARSVMEPWLRRQAALQRSALEARATSREVVGQVLRGLGTFLDHNGRFNQSLQQDLGQLDAGLDEDALKLLARELMQRGTELHEHGSQLGQSLQKAQQQAELALHRIRRLESELEQASQQLQQDPLTGALNRRGLDVAFVRDSARAAEQQRPLSVALLDLDHFKQINDSYGHDFGDEVLRGLVQVARKLVRPGDSIARMGGEEFMMLFPDTDADAAQRAVERLLQGFRNRRVLHRSTGQRVEMSFSAGVAQVQDGEAFGELYERADTALRQAKQCGRQQVLLADPGRTSGN